MIDTLMYVKKLEAAGVPREHAELQVEIMAELVDSNYATKQDFKDLRTEIKDLEVRMDHKFERLEDRLTMKLGSISVVGFAALAAVIKFL